MHMADALLSPAVGGTFWAVSAGTLAYCSEKLRREFDDRRVPLMGALGAFVFTAQMINFSIPGTGSSGHLGGGLLLAALLGPHAAFLTIASVLVVQALFFADGGLLALGCNIFNLGVIPAFVAYPLLFRPLAGAAPGRARLALASIAAATAGLLLGAFGVTVETACSGITDLPFATFAGIMLAIHLPIGLVEGAVTAAVLAFLREARPDILPDVRPHGAPAVVSYALPVALLLAAALVTGGYLSRFASESPDGLEWSVARTTGAEELKTVADGLHAAAARIQERIALLPGYAFPKRAGAPAVDPGVETGLAGLLGGLATLALALGAGLLLKLRARPVALA